MDALRIARRHAREAFQEIGEPLIKLPIDKLSIVVTDGEPRIYIRMDHFIEIAEGIVSDPNQL